MLVEFYNIVQFETIVVGWVDENVLIAEIGLVLPELEDWHFVAMVRDRSVSSGSQE